MQSRFMMRKLNAALFALAISASALASCSGGDSGYAPSQMPAGAEPVPQNQSVSGVSPEQVPTAPQQDGGPLGVPVSAEPDPDQSGAPQDAIPTPLPSRPESSAATSAVTPHCAPETASGTYTTLLAQGHVNGTTFVAATGSGESTWIRSQYATAKHAAAPKPSPVPAHALFIYSGTYTVDNAKGKVDTVGCATLVVAQNGATVKASRFGAPSKRVASGTVTKLTIAGLSKSGGSGTFVLSNKFTGTIRLTTRMTVP